MSMPCTPYRARAHIFTRAADARQDAGVQAQAEDGAMFIALRRGAGRGHLDHFDAEVV
jgi:hypothetical protein